jgi:hypothetical protein
VIISITALTKWSCNGDIDFFFGPEYGFLNNIYMDSMFQRVTKGKQATKILRTWRSVAFVNFQQFSGFELSLYL